MAEEDNTAESDSQFLAEVTARSNEVTTLLNKREKSKALVLSLSNPPIQAKSAEIKDANAAIIEKCLTTMTEVEINTAIETMDSETLGVFLKYIYRFMGKNFNCALMLKLHATLTDKAGMGAIVRVLTDRKTV